MPKKTVTLPRLDAAIEDAMRASIARWGVLVPVVRDRDGQIIDGHVRIRLAEDLGVPYPERHVAVSGPEEAQEIRLSLNADRRQLSEEQRQALVADLRREGHSTRAIAGALGTSKSTVDRDLQQLSRAGQLNDAPDSIRSMDGKERPAKRPAPVEGDVDLPPLEPELPAGQDLADRIVADFDRRHAAPPPAPVLPTPVEDGPEPCWTTGAGTVTVRGDRIEAALVGAGQVALSRDDAQGLADVLTAAVQRADAREPVPF